MMIDKIPAGRRKPTTSLNAIKRLSPQWKSYCSECIQCMLTVWDSSELLSWCDQNPELRYPVAAAGVTAFRSSDGQGPQWTALAHRILDKAPNRIEVLRKFIRQFSPPGWGSSQANTLESNLRLLDEIAGHADPVLAEFARKEKSRLSQAIAAVTPFLIPPDFAVNERFE
jgi:hypothetical protein